MSTTQNKDGATIVTMRATVALARGQVVILDAATDGNVTLPGGANATKTFGYSLNDLQAGELGPIHVSGGIAPAIAGGAIAVGDLLQTGATPGQVVTAAPAAGANSFLCGKALRAAALGDIFYVVPMHATLQG